MPADERLPRLLTAGEVRKLLDLAPQPYRLMFRWAVTTGFRRFEVSGLRLSDLPEDSASGPEAESLVQFDLVRKGGRLCGVYAPAQLLDETWWYVQTERPRSAQTGEQPVFLTRWGLPVSRSNLSRVFRRCADAAGSKATLHHLRHTFATNVLKVLDGFERDVEPMNSIKTLQVLLGHATVRSTEIYLRALYADSAAVAEVLGYLYGDTVF
jgi:integrase